MQLARARDELAVGRDDDRGVVAEAVARRRRARRATRARSTPVSAASRAANACVGPPGRASGSPRRRRARPSAIAKYGESVSSCRQTSRAPSRRGDADALGQRRLVLVGVGVPALLHGADAERRRGCGVRRRGRATRGGMPYGGDAAAACGSCGRRRNLLGDAVHAAAAVREHRARDADDLAAGVARRRSRAAPRRRSASPATGTITRAVARGRGSRRDDRDRLAADLDVAAARSSSTTSMPAGVAAARAVVLRSRSWFGLSGSARLCSSTRPGAMNATTLSTWPSVSSSSAIPSAEPDDPLDAEVASSAPSSISLARQRRVAVRVEQAPLGGHERARAVDGDRAALEHDRRARARSPRCSASSAADSASSRSYGVNFSPQRVEPRSATPTRGRRRRRATTIGPVSRIHESSIGSSTTSTLARARGARLRGLRAAGWRPSSPARTPRSRWRPPRGRAAPARAARPTARVRHGHAISVRSCGAHSAGITMRASHSMAE